MLQWPFPEVPFERPIKPAPTADPKGQVFWKPMAHPAPARLPDNSLPDLDYLSGRGAPACEEKGCCHEIAGISRLLLDGMNQGWSGQFPGRGSEI